MDNLRYTNPSKFDIAPYGTVVKVIGEDNNFTRWIQLNSNPEIHSLWTPMSKFFEDSFEKYLENEDFIQLLITINQHKNVESINNFGKFLSELTY